MCPLYNVLLCLLLVGGVCAYVSRQRNRNPIRWFFIGISLGLLGLIILYALPPKVKLTKTSSACESTSKNPFSLPADLTLHPGTQKLWYYLDNDNKQLGPMSFYALREAWIDDKITGSTYLWNEDMDDWKFLEDLSDIHAWIRGANS